MLELLDLAIGLLDPGIMSLPDERGVSGLLPAFGRVLEGRVPCPRVGAAHPHAA